MRASGEGYQPLATEDSSESSDRGLKTRVRVLNHVVKGITQLTSMQKKRARLWLLGTCVILCGGFWVLVYTSDNSLTSSKWHQIHRYIITKYKGGYYSTNLHHVDQHKLNSTYSSMLEKYKAHNNTCRTPATKVGFCKTHKTASSALQNILFRYGKDNNWTFAFYDEGSQLGPPHHQYNLIEPFVASWLDVVSWRPMVKQQGYDAFAVHAMWNKAEVAKLLGKSAAYITILREPVEQFESMYSYMKFEKELGMTLQQYVDIVVKDDLPDRRIHTYLGRNQQLWDLGRKPKDTETEEQVIQVIKQIEKEFDIVLIAEDMDSSLVLLSQELCWPINHFTTLKVNTRIKSKQIAITDDVRNTLRDWLWAEQMLYDYFKQVLDRRKLNYGLKALEAKVDELRRMNAQVEKVCVEGTSLSHEELSAEFKPWSDDVIGYKINDSVPWCKYYGMVENRFIDLLRETQRGRFQDWMLNQPEED